MGSQPLSLDQVYAILANRRRRYLLDRLTESKNGIPLSRLAREVAAWENNYLISEVSNSQYNSVYTALVQAHLPKLKAAGLIHYAQDRKEIKPTQKAFTIVRLYPNSSQGSFWIGCYLAATLSGLLLLVMGVVSSGPFSDKPIHWCNFSILLVYLLVTIGYAYQAKQKSLISADCNCTT